MIYYWTCYLVCTFPMLFLFLYRKDKLHELLLVLEQEKETNHD